MEYRREESVELGLTARELASEERRRNLGWELLDSRALELLVVCQKVEWLKWMDFQNRRT